MRKNLGLKALSLVLSLLVWLQIALSSEHHTIVRLPVVLDNVSPEITLSDLPKDVPFSVKGTGADLLKLRFSGVKVVLNASELKPGSDKLPLENYSLRDFSANNSIEILGPALESDVSVTTDVLHHKSVKVVPAFENEAARTRYAEQDYLLSPDQIRINGPRRVIRDLQSISTVPITLSMLGADRFDLPLSFSSSQISSTTPKVNVSRIPRRIEARVFEALRVEAGDNTVFPPIVTLKVEGTQEQVNALRPNSFVIKATQTPDADGWIELDVVLPEGIDKYTLTPSRVRLR
ncbi:MAG: hypothetical protein KBA79_00560 [Candidatus Cloacimonetes bacterium]|nr:hypothetical protein [Candidatus Cloacimonadota bacterium]HNZ07282.1 hypothetical protein [Candidatus Cloacimonadota bacterium]HPN40265.1 hypothetical protein [Candidatus Cloacimonadota bacterium]